MDLGDGQYAKEITPSKGERRAGVTGEKKGRKKKKRGFGKKKHKRKGTYKVRDVYGKRKKAGGETVKLWKTNSRQDGRSVLQIKDSKTGNNEI